MQGLRQYSQIRQFYAKGPRIPEPLSAPKEKINIEKHRKANCITDCLVKNTKVKKAHGTAQQCLL
jgi:hypothetical protein